MADNTILPIGGAGDTIRTEDRSGTKTPVSLIDVGGTTGAEAIIGDVGVTLPVSGTVTVTGVATAANQTTIIGHLDGVESLLTTMDADTGGIATSAASIDGKITACNTGAVVVSSSALPSGAATSAKQDTQITHLATLAGAVSGTEFQVDVLTMPTTTVRGTGTGNGVVSNLHDYAGLGIGSTLLGGSVRALNVRVLDSSGNGIGTGTGFPVTVSGTSSITVLANTVAAGGGTSLIPLVDTDGHLQVDVLSGGGGGTQYTEGDTDASITGTAILWEDAADTLRAVSTSKPLPVAQQGAVTVTGTVTANIGTVGTLATLAEQQTQTGHLSTLAGVDYATGADVASLAVVGGGTEATALRVTIANDSTGLVSIDDGGGSLTVDGTVAATQSGTWSVRAQDGSGNALTSAARGSERALSVQLVDASGNQITSFGGGDATAANQTTIIGHVDGIEALLTTIDADTSTLAAIDFATGADVASLAVVGGGTEAAALRVTIANDSTGLVSIDDGGGSLTVDGTFWQATQPVSIASVPSHDVTNAGTFAVQAAQSGTWTVQPGNTANTTAWLVTGTGGTFPVTDSGGTLTVDDGGTTLSIDDGAGSITVDNAALSVVGNGAAATAQRVTLANDSTGVIGTVTTVTTCSTVTTLTGSGVAHDAADSGNPHKIGVKATTSPAGLTLVASADRTDAMGSVDGFQYVRQIALEDVLQETKSNTDGASTAMTSGLAAPGAGIRLWICSVTIANSSASNITVDLRDGSGGSVLWTFPVPANGGVTHRFEPPLKLTANTALAFDGSAAATTLYVSANGFKSKV